MTSMEANALSIMGTALATLTVQMQQDRYAKDRSEELKDFVKLVMTGVQAIVSEAEGDAEYINVKAILDDIDTAMSDIIEIEEGEEPAIDHRQQYGTLHARCGRVA